MAIVKAYPFLLMKIAPMELSSAGGLTVTRGAIKIMTNVGLIQNVMC